MNRTKLTYYVVRRSTDGYPDGRSSATTLRKSDGSCRHYSTLTKFVYRPVQSSTALRRYAPAWWDFVFLLRWDKIENLCPLYVTILRSYFFSRRIERKNRSVEKWETKTFVVAERWERSCFSKIWFLRERCSLLYTELINGTYKVCGCPSAVKPHLTNFCFLHLSNNSSFVKWRLSILNFIKNDDDNNNNTK